MPTPVSLTETSMGPFTGFEVPPVHPRGSRFPPEALGGHHPAQCRRTLRTGQHGPRSVSVSVRSETRYVPTQAGEPIPGGSLGKRKGVGGFPPPNPSWSTVAGAGFEPATVEL